MKPLFPACAEDAEIHNGIIRCLSLFSPRARRMLSLTGMFK